MPTLAEVRLRACKLWPYGSFAILSLVPVEKPGLGTLAVDCHWRLYYDPAVLEAKPLDESAGAVLHEISHLLLKHHHRAEIILGKDADNERFFRWNVATDYAINSSLREQKIPLYEGVIYPEDDGFEPLLAGEEYFRRLERRAQEQQQEQQQRSPDGDGGQENGDDGQEEGSAPQGEEGDSSPAESDSESTGEPETGECRGDSGSDETGSQPQDAGDDGESGGQNGVGQSDSEGGAGDDPSDGTDGDGSGDAGDGQGADASGLTGEDAKPAGTGSGQSGGGTGGDDGGQGSRQPGAGGNGQAESTVPKRGGAADTPPQHDRPAPNGGSCSDGRPRPWEEPAPSECSTPGIPEHEQEIICRETAKRIVEKALGNQGGMWGRWAEEIITPRIDPRVALLRHVRAAVEQTCGVGDYSYRRPSRRNPRPDMLLPTNVQPVPRITILVDTSGSMDQTDLGLCLGLIAKVLHGFRLRDGIHVVTGDTHANTAARVFGPRQVQLVGGGGTDMGSMIAQADAAKPKPHLIVVATDGVTPWGVKPSVPVVACLTRAPHPSCPIPPWIKAVSLV